MSKLTISLAAAGLAASLGAYAAVPTGAAPFQVVVPNLKSGIEVTLEGLYVQPTNSDLDYLTSVTTIATGVTSSSVSTVDPSYDFGFRVGLGYIFPDSGNDVQADWTHFDQATNESQSFAGANFDVFSKPGIEYDSTLSTNNLAVNSSADFDYDAVNLTVGQYLSLGTRLQTRLFAGARYAELQNNITDTYTGVVATTNVAEVDYYNSKFTGVGPTFGVDASYHIANCFGLVGHLAASLLVGRVEASSTINSTPTTTLNVSADNQTRVVPGFDAKLGLDYSIPFQNDASRFTIEAGYQATQYVDAIDRLNADVDTNVVTRTTSGVGFNGPYLSLNYKM